MHYKIYVGLWSVVIVSMNIVASWTVLDRKEDNEEERPCLFRNSISVDNFYALLDCISRSDDD